MIVVTSEAIAGKRIVRTLGLVRGNTIRARHIGKDIMASLRMIVGGEIHEYAKLMAEAREQSIDRMTAEAQLLGANAIVSVRMTTSVMMGGAAELLALGTAVVVEDEPAAATSDRRQRPPTPGNGNRAPDDDALQITDAPRR